MSGAIEKQLGVLADVCRRVQSKYFIDNCCIAATRTGLCVLEELGVRKARPLLVAAAAFNGPFMRGERLPPAAYVAIDLDRRKEEGLAGHLVIIGKVGSRKFFLDLSAYQMDRPQKGIHVESGILFAVYRPLSNSGPDWSLEVELPEGGQLVYGKHPHPGLGVSWEHSPNWTLPTERHRQDYGRVVQELLAAVREEASR